ncbi:MAG: DNA polymerase III subunit beta [Alphaproteobacteria bacterium]
MRLMIDRNVLLRTLSHAQSVVERRNTIPILANVKLDVADGKLSLSATDMEIGLLEAADADPASQPGSATAPAHTLHDIVRKLPDGAQVELALDSEAERMIVRAGRSTFQLAVLPTADFPSLADSEMPIGFKMAARDLRTLIDRTRFAISTEETRYYLNGIYFHTADHEGVKVLRAVATDGHRLARAEAPLPDGAAGMPGVIVPRKTVGELRKLLEEAGDAYVEVSVSETKIRFAMNGVVLTSKLIDGAFPDYERVIPAGNDKSVQIDRQAFKDAVDRVSTIATEKSRAVKLALQQGAIVVSANNAEAGAASEEIEADYDAESMEIGFNSRYLLDIANQIEGDIAELVFADPAAPAILRDKADASALYVLMPMRV